MILNDNGYFSSAMKDNCLSEFVANNAKLKMCSVVILAVIVTLKAEEKA